MAQRPLHALFPAAAVASLLLNPNPNPNPNPDPDPDSDPNPNLIPDPNPNPNSNPNQVASLPPAGDIKLAKLMGVLRSNIFAQW